MSDVVSSILRHVETRAVEASKEAVRLRALREELDGVKKVVEELLGDRQEAAPHEERLQRLLDGQPEQVKDTLLLEAVANCLERLLDENFDLRAQVGRLATPCRGALEKGPAAWDNRPAEQATS